VEVVFSDGEHLGIPLAIAMRVLRIRTPHLVIGHHLTTPAKMVIFRWVRAHRRMDRILVHSANQIDMVAKRFAPLAEHLCVVPYGVDTQFWSPQPIPEQGDLLVSAGREHRDYDCLLRACPDSARLFIADDSLHSPNARRREPDRWPANVERRGLDRIGLRTMYARAAVVAVPVIDTPLPFGITTVLEAMSMGKVVVVSATEGLSDVIEDGVTGVLVPPGDDVALRNAIEGLLGDPKKRREVGRRARRAAIERFGLDIYVANLARHLHEVAQLVPDRSQP
jgi:glycosyltransferase involved in cell wall biosynthesis